MSYGEWNILSGCVKETASEGKRQNAWFKEIAREYNKNQKENAAGKALALASSGSYSHYNPYDKQDADAGPSITGYQQKQHGNFGGDTLKSMQELYGPLAGGGDANSSAIAQFIQVDAHTGVTSASESLYGKVDHGPDGKNFFQIGASLLGDVVDTFVAKEEMLSPAQDMYASSGKGVFDTGGGLFANWGTGNSAANERRDQFGNVIRTEGLQDYVEEGGRRYNIDFAGNRTETDAFGCSIATANDVNGFLDIHGWNKAGGWSSNSLEVFYGTAWSNNETSGGNIYSTFTTAEGGGGSIYRSYDTAQTTPNDVTGFLSTTGWNSETGGWNNAAIADIYGTSSSSSGNGYTTQTADAGGNIWGYNPGDVSQQASYSSGYDNNYNNTASSQDNGSAVASFYGLNDKKDWA